MKYVRKILNKTTIKYTHRYILNVFVNTINRTDKTRMLNFYSQFINKNDLCFDVGANIGNRTDVFMKLGSKVVSVEPQDIPFQILKKLYGDNDNVTIINKGLADRDGYLELRVCEDATTVATMSEEWTKSGIFPNFKWNKIQNVPVTTLDNLIEIYGVPKFCKIDVEGFEFEVLKGLTQPIQYISFEFHRVLFEDMEKCIIYLENLGYTKFNYSIGESFHLLPLWVSSDELYKKISDLNSDVYGDVYCIV